MNQLSCVGLLDRIASGLTDRNAEAARSLSDPAVKLAGVATRKCDLIERCTLSTIRSISRSGRSASATNDI